MVDEPNQGAAGDTTDTDAWATGDAGPAGAGAPINQGAAGAGPEGGSAYEPGADAHGESPLTAERAGDASPSGRSCSWAPPSPGGLRWPRS